MFMENYLYDENWWKCEVPYLNESIYDFYPFLPFYIGEMILNPSEFMLVEFQGYRDRLKNMIK